MASGSRVGMYRAGIVLKEPPFEILFSFLGSGPWPRLLYFFCTVVLLPCRRG
jgi:hypothetical protein